MGSLSIRAMQEADLERVEQIERENFSVPWSARAFLESLTREDTVFLVAVLDREVAGYLGCYCIAGTGEITNVAVDRRFRRKGIAAALLQRLLQEAEEKGTREILLEVRESNTPAIALYESQGFEKEGIRKNFYERPVEDAIIMWKRW